jgi:cellulose synthase/poly-beta-1,6-N-acetylglucosamine synthase-like glycosyltransferase
MMLIYSLIIVCIILILFYATYFVFGLLYGNPKRLIGYEGLGFKPNVSIVTATFNEEKIIGKKLKNILDLSYPPKKLEFIFVDCSSDRTPEIINAFKEKNPSLDIKLIHEIERSGLASALNLGYSSATGDLIVKSDCDIDLRYDSIDNIVSFFKDPTVGCVSGVGIVENDLEKSYRDIQIRLRIAESALYSTYLMDTFSCFRRELIEPISNDSAADDAELAISIIRKNYKSLINVNAKFFEVCASSFKERRKQRDRRAEGHVRLLLRNLDLLFNSNHGYFGVFIYPSNFFMMIVSPWLILLTIILSPIALLPILAQHSAMAYFVMGLLMLFIIISFHKLESFLDSQLSLIIGHLRIITGKKSAVWEKIDR